MELSMAWIFSNDNIKVQESVKRNMNELRAENKQLKKQLEQLQERIKTQEGIIADLTGE